VMRNVDSPQNTVKKPAMHDVRKYFKPAETENCQ
jgi:hypothetical protein